MFRLALIIGLIFAMTGKQIGVLDNNLFAALLLMIIVTSIITPIVLNKVGTKIKNIRLVDGDHNIDCKIDGIGAMKLKSEFVKKVSS